MRHKGVSKEEMRERILDASAKCFNKFGYAGIGIEGLAKSAEVTSGAIYSQFGSKEEVFNAVLKRGLDSIIETLSKHQQNHGDGWIEFFADYYLGLPHRSDFETGCIMAALTSEVTRFSDATKAIYGSKMQRITRQIAKGLPDNNSQNQETRAWSLLSTLIGGINIARGIGDEKIAGPFSDAVKISAVREARGQL